MSHFHDTLRAVLASSFAAGLAACSSGVDRAGLEPVACVEGGEPLPGVVPAAPADYVEIRTGRPGVVETQKRSRGSLCASAADKPKCEADYAAVTVQEGDRLLFGQAVQDFRQELVVTSDAAGLHVLRTAAAVEAWLGPIDSRGDAVARVELAGYVVACQDGERAGVGEAGAGYRVAATRLTGDCDPIETTQYLLEVDREGTVREVDSAVLESTSGACIGRRPEGLAPARRRPPRNALAESLPSRAAQRGRAGAWLAEVARLEAASVASFDRVAAELEAFGAPASLVARARAAARDEVRHAAFVRTLAEARGACVEAPVVAPFGPRDLEAFALENAVEGCVLETFGALVGMTQAELAEDADVRRVMRGIAADEARHGELAWAVHAWAVHALEPAAAQRVRRARDQALRALVASAASAEPELDDAAARALGVLRGAARRALASRFASAAAALEHAA